MNENNNKDPNFNLSLGNFNVNLSSNNLITETDHRYEKKGTDYNEHLTTEKFTEIFHDDFEFHDKSHNSPKRYRENLRETARFSNCEDRTKTEMTDEKCEFRKNFPSNIRNSIKENICVDADSGEEQSANLNTETYNRPKLNKKLCSNNYTNKFILKKKETKKRNTSVILQDGNNSTCTNKSGKLGFEIIPMEEFKMDLPKLGSSKNIDTKSIRNTKPKMIENKDKNDENSLVELFPLEEKDLKEKVINNLKYDSNKIDPLNSNPISNETKQFPFQAKKKFGSQKDIHELKNIQKKIYSPLKNNEQESPKGSSKEKRKSIDFNKRTHLKKEDMSNSNIINIELNNYSQASENDLELECCSEQIMDFRESFKKNPDLLKYFSDLRNLKHLEEFIKTKLLKKEEDTDKDNTDNIEKLKEELNKFDEINQDLKKKLDKKHREFLEYKSKYDNMAFDNEILERKITELKSQLKSLPDSNNDPNLNTFKQELKEKEENIVFLQDEIASLKENIENLKNELNTTKKDSLKVQKQSELHSKVNKLEEENTNLKNKLNSEMNLLKESKKQAESLKEFNNELKCQHETLNNKYHNIMEENYTMKKDYLNLEKELKVKTETVNKLTNDLESLKHRGDRDKEFSTNFRSIHESPVKEYDNKKVINFHKRKISMETLEESLAQNKGNNFLNYKNSSLAESSENSQTKKNNSISTNVQSSISSNFDNSSLSSLKHISNDIKQSDKSKKAQVAKNDYLKNEARIIDLEKKLISLQKSKEQVVSELSKMPEFPKQKVQILKKKSLEHTINEFNAEINTYKTELRGLHSLQKEF